MDIQNLVSDLRSERARLDRAIAALESLSQPARRRGRPPKARQATPASSRKRGGITPAGRRRLAEMMRKRWATWKGKSAPKAAKTTRKKPNGRRSMSAAARKKLSELA